MARSHVLISNARRYSYLEECRILAGIGGARRAGGLRCCYDSDRRRRREAAARWQNAVCVWNVDTHLGP